jgi:hypothetical protein
VLSRTRVAREVTGYERGTITPLGSTMARPVVADGRPAGEGRGLSRWRMGAGRLCLAGDPQHLGTLCPADNHQELNGEQQSGRAWMSTAIP